MRGSSDVVAVPLPVGEAARERDDVLVAELAERLGGERRACAGGAVEDERRRPVGGDALDARLEVAARHVHGAGDVALFPLVPLAHVDEERVGQLARCRRVDLGDLVLASS